MFYPTTNEELQNIINTSKIAIVYFTASWCRPCQQISSLFEFYNNNHSDTISFVKIDIDEATSIVNNYNITSLPSFYIYVDGKLINNIVGANQNAFIEMIEEYI